MLPSCFVRCDVSAQFLAQEADELGVCWAIVRLHHSIIGCALV